MNTILAAQNSLRTGIESVPQPWRRLAAYFAQLGRELEVDPLPLQFAGGFANLNYLVRIDGQNAVLRRPPRGPWPPGAYDMAREFRILSRLWEQFPLAPRGLHLCEDARIVGAPFQIIEFRPGVSFRDCLPATLSGDESVAARLGDTLIDLMVQLHRVSPDEIGLSDLGKPVGFLRRAAEGWIRRASIAVEGWGTTHAMQLIVELAHWLREHQVDDQDGVGSAVLLHNDFKLDNLLLDPVTLAPLAVIDWDQGTRGDGLFDLATLLSYWTEPDDPPVMHRLGQMPTANAGFPTRREAAERYAQALGRDLNSFRFYRVLAQLRTAVLFQQLHSRWRHGEARDQRYASFGQLGEGLLEFARSIARGEVF